MTREEENEWLYSLDPEDREKILNEGCSLEGCLGAAIMIGIIILILWLGPILFPLE